MRNARRLLENLRLRFPDDPKINKKIEEIRGISLEIQSDNIADRVVKVRQKETELFPPPSAPPQEKPMEFPEADAGEKLTAADLFADTDIIPDVSPVEGEKKYYTLSDKIKEELDAIRAIYHHQIRGDTTIVEKTLENILSDFRKSIDEKVDKEDYESRYNLAIAFLEQGLLDEAIEECKLAAKSKKFEIDCYNIISFCFKKKKDFPLALSWLERAQDLIDKDSHRALASKYEMASIYEDMKEKQKALKSYQEVKKWDADYRDVKNKVSLLQNNNKSPSNKK
jgi:tetratricopeptide (TPR) repeat protein